MIEESFIWDKCTWFWRR